MKWGFPKIRGTLLGVPTNKIIVFRGLFGGPRIFGKYQMWMVEHRVLEPAAFIGITTLNTTSPDILESQ